MRRFILPLVMLASLAFAPAASAVYRQEWGFRGTTDGEWQSQGLTSASQGADGLRFVVGPVIGGLGKQVALDRRYDVAEVILKTENKTTGYVIWHIAGTPQNEMPQVGFEVAGSGSFQKASIPLSYYPQWSDRVDFLGIGFDAGSDVTLASVGLASWGTLEKIGEVAKGFWTFDEYKPLSINFLWGPLLSYNPAMRAELYATLPPRAHSATQWMYGILGILLLLFLLSALFLPSRKHEAFGLLCAGFAGLWLLFDARMGAELLSYAANDVGHYVLAPTGEKKLRTHELIYDVLNRALPRLKTQERYGIVTSEGAFYSLVRYQSYPTLAIRPDQDQAGITDWLVAYRPEAAVDEQGRLTLNGTPLTGPGKIVERYNDKSFLFSTRP